MDEAQANPAIRFIVTFGHRAAYSSGSHAGLATIRSILDSLGVHHGKYVLNLNGHSHDYERTTPQFGVTHITVGIGGATLEEASGACLWAGGCPPPAWSVLRLYHHGALQLAFGPTGIQGQLFCGPNSAHDDMTCTSGQLLDLFTITGQGVTAAPPSAAEPIGLAMEAIRPNPAASSFTLEYSLVDGGEVRLELLDVAGRVARRIALAPAGPGRNQALVSAPRDLGPGIYWLRLTQSGRSVRRSVVLLP